MMIDSALQKDLQNTKNLLAFSAGIDSSALFFILIENNIPFDIALVNYQTRDSSNKEEIHAKTLAKKYNIVCHTIKAPKFTTHFEKSARDFRYNFFETLIKEHGYNRLLTAHQLNDQLEWLLMRFTKGAGTSELVGLEPISQKNKYMLMRPLLKYSKDELLDYLKSNSYPYFVDESNSDEKHERNYFRKQFSDPLISKYREGIGRSFEYIRSDKEKLEKDFELIFSQKELKVIKLHTLITKVKATDIALKKLGYLLSASQRQEVEREKSLVIGGEWAVVLQDNLLYIAPYYTTDMPKKFREECRVLKVPQKIRAYCFKENLNIQDIP